MDCIPDAHLQSPIRYCMRKYLCPPRHTTQGKYTLDDHDLHFSAHHEQIDQQLVLLKDREANLRKGKKSIPLFEAQKPAGEHEFQVPPFLYAVTQTIPVDPRLIVIESEKLYGSLLTGAIQNGSVHKWVDTHLPLVHDAIVHHLKTHLGTMLDGKVLDNSRFDLTRRHLALYSSKTEMEDIRTTMQDMKIKNMGTWKPIKMKFIDTMAIYVCHSFVIWPRKNVYYLLDYDQIMMLTDTITSRVLTLIYMDLNYRKPGYVAPYILELVYKRLDRLLEEKGNEAYNEIKEWEPMILGLMLKKFDILEAASKFSNWHNAELAKNGFTAMEGVQTIIAVAVDTPSELSELHGIYRHWGHPTVNEEEGCKKVKKIAHCRPPPRWTTLKKITALLKRQFCISFIGEKGRWPNIYLRENLKHTPLGKAIETNNTSLNLHMSTFTLDDWYKIRFEKEFDFDFHKDFTEDIDDKSLSSLRHEVPGVYNKSKLRWNPKPLSTSRRVLLEALSRKEIDIESICRVIMRRQVPETWKVILVHAKEREMKIAPRLFAMMVLEMRLYFCITEANLADNLFKYYPQQSMTLDEADLTKRIYSLSTDRGKEDFISIISSLDFKSWNIHWQKHSTDSVFGFIDDLYGTPNLFTYTHEFFESCLVALASHHNPPASLIGDEGYQNWKRDPYHPESCDTLWYNHRGGFEGLRQKGWTLITIGLLLLVEYNTGLRSYILGQGDNQLSRILISKKNDKSDADIFIKTNQKYLSEILEMFISVLDKNAAEIGLAVKPEESWFSSSLLIYGKDMVFKGAFLPQAAKRISRTMVDVNEIFPSVVAKMSTLQTTGLATSQKGYSFLEPYIICTMETLITLLRELDYSVLLKRSHPKVCKDFFLNQENLECLLHLSSDVGACPLLPWISYLYRGHPDDLTVYTSMICIGVNRGCEFCRKTVYYLYDDKYKKGPGDPELLLSNPTAVNIDTPSLMGTIMRKQLETVISSKNKNIHLKQLFSSAAGRQEEAFYKALMSTHPFYPRVLHVVLMSSAVGAKLSFIAQFYNTRTTQQLFTKEKSNLYKNISESETKIVHHWITSINNIKTLSPPPFADVCPTMIAQRLRDHSWSDLVPCGIKGVTVPHPIHQLMVTKGADVLHKDCSGDSEYVLFQLQQSQDHTKLLTTRGSYPPYLGSKTKEKITGKIYQIPQKSRPLSSSQRLTQIRDWCIHPYSQLYSLVNELIEGRTNVSLEILQLTSGSIVGGSHIHRLNDHITKRGTLNNFRPNITTHVYISSDELGKYSRGKDNYNMHIQGFFHFGYCILEYDTYHGVLDYDTLHLHISCEYCTHRLDEILITGGEEWESRIDWSGNPLMYSHVDEIPTVLNSNNPVLSFMNGKDPAIACGALLLSRVIRNLNRATWGVTDPGEIHSSPIRVFDLMAGGIDRILLAFAYFLFLYFSDASRKMSYTISQTLTIEVWRDVATNCLVPEILYTLVKTSGQQAPAGLYTTSTVVRVLNRVVLNHFKDMKSTIFNGDYPSWSEFYILPSCGFKKIFSMWLFMLQLILRKDYSWRVECVKLLKTSKNLSNLPTHESSIAVLDYFRKTLSPEDLKLVLTSRKLRLSKLQPEQVMRNENTGYSPKAIPSYSPSAIRPTINLNLNPRWIKIPERTRSKVPVVSSNSEEFERPLRTFIDHQYNLVGCLSSSSLKFLEIIERNNITSECSSICLADGEGTVSHLLYQMSGHPSYFNTYINRQHLVMHRATSYIPSAFTLCPEGVRLAEFSALTGGDLTDPVLVDRFIDLLPHSQYDYLTFDAENDIDFSFSINCKFWWCIHKILSARRVKSSIIKTYINDVSSTMVLVDTLQKFYSDVSVTVPIFSSNETYEILVVGKNPYYTDLSSSFNSCYVDSSVEASRASLNNLRATRIQPSCHQEQFREWKLIIRLAILYEVPVNLGFTLEQYTNNIIPFVGDDIDQVEQWCLNFTSSIHDLIRRELVMIGKGEGGVKLTLLEKALMSADHVVHNILEKWIVALVNIKLLMATINIHNQKDVLDELSRYVSSTKHIKIDGVVVYTWRIPFTEWRSRYLRIFWKLWGHFRWCELL